MEMWVKTKNGKSLNVGAVDKAQRQAVIDAEPFTFTEFHYTGNSLKGENSGNYEEFGDWLKECGLNIIEEADDLADILFHLDHSTGVTVIAHRGVKLTLHVQGRKGKTTGFGYTTIIEFRFISCE